jgi:hypothetical protein
MGWECQHSIKVEPLVLTACRLASAEEQDIEKVLVAM